MWSDLTSTEWVRYEETLGGEVEILAAAVRVNNTQQVDQILGKLDKKQGALIMNAAIIESKPLLHFAAFNGHLEMLKLLLSRGADPTISSHVGRTALHEAVCGCQLETAALLLDIGRDVVDTVREVNAPVPHAGLVDLAYDSVATMAQTLVNMKDQGGLTPILILADSSFITEEQFSEMVRILVDSGADIGLAHPGDGQNALYRAVELRSLTSCKKLVEAGAHIDHKDFLGDTVLHLAASRCFTEILEYLLQNCRQGVNEKNLRGETAMHFAAVSGSRECVMLLINFGADISIENNEEQSVLDYIYCHLPRPKRFLLEILNSKIIPNHYSINDRLFELTMDFRMLTPDRENQMSVVVSFIKNLSSRDLKQIIEHPLVATYIQFKWTRMRWPFIILVLLHILFVISFSFHIMSIALYNLESPYVIQSRRVLIPVTVIISMNVILQTLLAPKYFLREAETWLILICVSCSFIITIKGELDPKSDDKDWFRHITSYAVLLVWCHVVIFMGRFPTIGFYALMFYTVLKNVLRVLFINCCIVIGFTLSFCIQFNIFRTEGIYVSLVRTTVMMMGEFNHDELFEARPENPERREFPPKLFTGTEFLSLTSRAIFILFILLGPIVSVNLMIGMAVNDIQALQDEGNLRHIIKQAEFLLHIDSIFSRVRPFGKHTAIPSVLTFNPSTRGKIKESSFRRLGLNISSDIIEGIVEIALKNQNSDDVSREIHIV